MCKFLGITSKTLSLSSTGPRRVKSHNDVIVAFDGAACFKNLSKAMYSKCKVQLAHFECSLGYHILSCGGIRDIVRCNGSMDPSQDSVNIRIRFGFGRIQPAVHRINLLVNGATYDGGE